MAERKWTKQALSNFRHYQNEFNKQTYKGYSFRLNKESEDFIINFLETEQKGNITNYIRTLILKDMKSRDTNNIRIIEALNSRTK